MPAKRGEYKGSETISLHQSADCSDGYPFSFGVKKAELILLHLQDIINFVREKGDPTLADNIEDRLKVVDE